MESYTKSYTMAIRDFQQARNEALKEEFWSKITGESSDLISYDEVKTKLKFIGSSRKGLRDIPLDAIIGSVGRYSDFTRKFNPRQDSDAERWANIEVKTVGAEGLPPIEVYKVGETYFVIDGNHRVSVARHLGFKTIEAYVTEIETRVPLPPNAQPDDIILRARYIAFLEKTGLDKLRPDANLTVTVPGQYRVLEQHIELHRKMMEIERGQEITNQDAVLDWYDNVYSVVVNVIREQNILKHFPRRTETDIYLWISGYRLMLQNSEEWGLAPHPNENNEISPDSLDMPAFGFLPRLATKLRNGMSTTPLEADDIAPGEWRRGLLVGQIKKRTKRLFRLFTNILVPVSGDEVGWYALHQALGIARREGGRLVGLHIIPEPEQTTSTVEPARAYFNRHCTKAGIPGRLTIKAGNVAQTICDYSRFVDLTVIKLNHPPATQPLARLESGLRTIIRQCRSPILTVPQAFVYPLDRALLAYDGSPKSREALFLATYLGSRWQIPLTVVTVTDRATSSEILTEAKSYLAPYNINVTFVAQTGPAAEAIITTSQENSCDLIIMGSYGYNRMLELVLGSTVDEVLRTSTVPTLICR